MITGPTIGLIVPPADAQIPPEVNEFYPTVKVLVEGLGVNRMEADDFDRVFDAIESATRSLVDRGADAISLMGTSLSFYLGKERNDALVEQISGWAGGRPTSSMTTAVDRALHAAGAQRIVVLAAYGADMSGRLVTYLRESQIEVVSLKSLGISAISDLSAVDTAALVSHGDRLLGEHPHADALLISCGGLRTTEATKILSQRWQRPVVSSAIDGLHDAVRLAADITPAP